MHPMPSAPGYCRALSAAGAAAALAAAAACAPGGGDPGGGGSEPPATWSPSAQPTASPTPERPTATPEGDGPFVYNMQGEPPPQPDVEPEKLTASEFTTFTGLTWSEWDTEHAVAEGEVAGTWCMPSCMDDPYRVTVELTDPAPVDGSDYFTRFRVLEGDAIPAEHREAFHEVDSGDLALP